MHRRNIECPHYSPNGLPESVSSSDLTISRTFSGYGELDDQTVTVGSQTAIQWALTRDDAGRIITKTETADGITHSYVYTYDSMGRLLTVTRDDGEYETYTYDLSGTRVTETNTLRGITNRSLSYSDEDHLLTAGDAVYTYDLDGFLTSKKEDGLETTYTYSSRGELLEVELSDGSIITYDHDPLGRRIAKSIDGVIVEKYLWQGLTKLLAVYDSSDTLVQRFEYADSRMPVAMTQDGSTYFLACDQVGSLRIVTDASGNVVKRIDYDTFGNILNDTNSSLTVPFGFASGLHDSDIGLVRFGYRDYDPDTGRWTAKDPIGFAGGDTDLYGYVQNNPVNWIDPEGLETLTIGPGGLPLILPPKTDAQIEADRQLAEQLADWVEDHYNPDWFQDTLDLLWNDPIDYWSNLLGDDDVSSAPCSMAAEHTKNKSKKNWDKHTNRRPGDPNLDKKRQPRKRGRKWKTRK